MIQRLKSRILRLRTEQEVVERQLAQAKEKLARAQGELEITLLTRALLQRIAVETQGQLRFRITTLGTLALSSIFPEPVELELNFTEERGRTAARLMFRRQDGEGVWHDVDPMEGDGGGLVDIAAIGLRASMLLAERPSRRPILILDEPLKALNDSSREMHRKMAQMLERISSDLGIQFLIISMVPELEEVGERVKI